MSRNLLSQFGVRCPERKFQKENICSQMIGEKSTKIVSQIPSSLDVRFREDYNIRYIYEIVLEKITIESQGTQVYDMMISLARLAASMAETDSCRKNELRRAENLEKNKNIFCSEDRVSDFKNKAIPLLNEYNRIPKTINIIDFGKSNDNYYPTEDDLARIKVIKDFVNIASSYIEINMVCTGEKPSNASTLCLNCGIDLSMKKTNAQYIEYCPSCNYRCSMKQLISKVNRSDVDEHKPTGTCNELGNFVKAINHYQGNVKLTKYSIVEISELLDDYFTKNGLPIGVTVIETRSLNKRGQREGTSVDMMIKAMKSKCIDCYNYVNFICRSYWGWELPCISHLYDIIISDYIKTQEVRCTLSIEERGGKSNIPVRLRLCEHLKKRGCDCEREDFKLPNDIEKYIRGWEIMCEKSGVPELMAVRINR